VVYSPGDLVGTFTTGSVDEEVSAGLLTRTGFFDLIESGDEVFLREEPETAEAPAPEPPANAELRALLRSLR
jgi:hypothetical protein